MRMNYTDGTNQEEEEQDDFQNLIEPDEASASNMDNEERMLIGQLDSSQDGLGLTPGETPGKS